MSSAGWHVTVVLAMPDDEGYPTGRPGERKYQLARTSTIIRGALPPSRRPFAAGGQTGTLVEAAPRVVGVDPERGLVLQQPPALPARSNSRGGLLQKIV